MSFSIVQNFKSIVNRTGINLLLNFWQLTFLPYHPTKIVTHKNDVENNREGNYKKRTV